LRGCDFTTTALVLGICILLLLLGNNRTGIRQVALGAPSPVLATEPVADALSDDPPLVGEATHNDAVSHNNNQAELTRDQRHQCTAHNRVLEQKHFSVHAFIGLEWGVEPIAASVFAPYFAAACSRNAGPLAPMSSAGAAADDGPGAVLIDVGANDGEDILAWYYLFGREGQSPCAASFRYYFLEPQAQYAAALSALAKSGGGGSGRRDARVVLAAAGRDQQHGQQFPILGSEHQGTVDLVTSPELRRAALARGSKHAMTRVVSLRRLLDDEKVAQTTPILLLKVDCEGADATIVTDSGPLFAARRVHVLIFEVHERQKFFPSSHRDAAKMLEQFGYHLLLVGRDRHSDSIRFLALTASQLAAWPAKLSTVVAVSPDVMTWMARETAPFAPQHRHLPGTVNYAKDGCALWAVDVPCRVCWASAKSESTLFGRGLG
jgi:hypothetical protein